MISARTFHTGAAACLAIALGACACTGTKDRGESSAPPVGAAGKAALPAPEKGAVRFEAVVRAAGADDKPEKLVGATVEQDDGTSWVVAYQAGTPFHALRERRVLVEGTPYAPQGQALMMRHLRVAWMKVVRPDVDAELVEARGEEALTGTFEEHEWPAGTKLAGEKVIRFVATTGETFLVSKGDGKPWLGKPVTLTAHRVEPSPFIARPGGPYLWMMAIEAR